MDEAELEKIINEVDKNKDGIIDKEEFFAMMKEKNLHGSSPEEC